MTNPIFLLDELNSNCAPLMIDIRKEEHICLKCHKPFDKSVPYINGVKTYSYPICPKCTSMAENKPLPMMKSLPITKIREAVSV